MSLLKSPRVIYLSSYIPRRCGIATYTKDLTNAINLLNPHPLAEIAAMDKGSLGLDYPAEVKIIIDQENPQDYLTAARFINQSRVDLVSLQHEFGLFGGGRLGKYLLPLVERLRKPIVTTLHSLPDDVASERGQTLIKIIRRSKKVVVMIDPSREKLVKDYGIPRSKIAVIPHGIPDLPLAPTITLKRRHHMAQRLVMGSINLLSRSKGIEYALAATALIKQQIPQVLYLVIGQTHPEIVKKEGESYRRFLQKVTRHLGIHNNVRFINRYLSLDELIGWLKTIDVYLTPYLVPKQAASGSLSYAVGAGKFCISTPYFYARELLLHKRGVLVPFRDPRAIAQAIVSYWRQPEKKQAVEKRAYAYGRLMTWPNVAMQYLNLFCQVKK